jgi:hypothetical protein
MFPVKRVFQVEAGNRNPPTLYATLQTQTGLNVQSPERFRIPAPIAAATYRIVNVM